MSVVLAWCAAALAAEVNPPLPTGSLLIAGRVKVTHVDLPRSRLALVASDHVPLVADLRVG